MKTTRRNFIATALSGSMAATLPLSACESPCRSKYPDEKYAILDEMLKLPVLRRDLFTSPVIIDSIELLQDRNNFICRVRSKDGAEGISVGHPNFARHSYPMFISLLRPLFLGKDARDLDALVTLAYESNYKHQGIPYCVQIANLEFAILDMLGNIANVPAGKLLGEIHNPEIAVYQGSRYTELRRMPPEESLELVKKDLEESKAKAIKIRAGLGDNRGTNGDNAPGRTEKLIKMAREEFGDSMVLMIDGNGSYDVAEAIRIGKILEEYNFYFYEEPVPWDWYEEQKRVADALQIPMAGGEEEFSLHAFRWLIANDAFEIVQPDHFYFGGMIRSMQVARMAEAFGKSMVPHMTTGGLGFLYMLHFVSACPNAGEYHEFKLFATNDANGNTIPIQSKTEPFSSVNGIVKVPTGSGLGIIIDPEYISTHNEIKA